jgi:hypothetical protein
MTFRWGKRVSIAFAVLSTGLHAGFYLSPYKGHFLRLIGMTECVPIAIASWSVSKTFPACFPTLRQVILFEALVPILAGAQGFIVGLGIDAFLRLRATKTQ